jgi:hypothetical protein
VAQTMYPHLSKFKNNKIKGEKKKKSIHITKIKEKIEERGK